MDCFFSGSKAFFKTCANWKDIILINDETGNPYTKGYISKLVKNNRERMSELLQS